ncbi:NAD(P)H-dependent oxidoreductase subunit E, partial [Noviherbaspirillum soli]|uniref:NAD(P)H-dependent oxidoreductase subunit E n=1 Tax=Noviherbaspirillum soli TaxID=1064518 RepID=UPI00188DAA68
MNKIIIPIAVQGASKQRKRQAPKGRRVDPQALSEVQALLGDMPRRRDLLIECLHLVQDRYRCLSTQHLAALAQELRMAQTEVYEVASFYHHFDIVREGEDSPAALTVRVCDGIACELAGAGELIERLPAILGADVRVLAAPCVGRCEQAPVAVVGQKPIPQARCETVQAAVQAGEVADAPAPGYLDHAGYLQQGGYQLLRQCLSGERDVDSVLAAMESSGLRGLGGAGFPAGRKWRIVRAEAGPRLMAVNIDEGEPGTFKDRVYLETDPHRFLEGMLI